FLAARVLVFALAAAGNTADLPEVARRCLEIGTRQHAPELEEIRDLLVELAAPEPPTAPEELDAEDPFLAELSEANRLARLGDVDGVSRLVDRAKQAEGIGKQQLGWLEGVLGNALQNAQRDEEAVDEYEVAANLLEEAGDAEAVSQALSYRAVSL